MKLKYLLIFITSFAFLAHSASDFESSSMGTSLLQKRLILQKLLDDIREILEIDDLQAALEAELSQRKSLERKKRILIKIEETDSDDSEESESIEENLAKDNEPQPKSAELSQAFDDRPSEMALLLAELAKLKETNAALQQTIEEEREKSLCSICMDEEKTHTLVPCGHVYCEGCLPTNNHCYSCRAAITQIQKIYY